MANTRFRDGGGGRRRGYAGGVTSALCLLLISTLMVGCSLDSPSSPNQPGQLTGQTPNQQFTFSGTITLSRSSNSTVADDNSTVVFIATVRDASGNPIPNLTTVNFSTDLGGFVVGTSGDGAPVTSSFTAVATFNGQAEVSFVSVGGATGKATVTASIGSTSASRTVEIEEPPLEGTIALAFGTGGTGAVTMSGTASQASPLDAEISVLAVDSEGDPIAGAKVTFRIVQDSTTDDTSNDRARFLVERRTTTGPAGDAVNILRAFGPGVVVVVAELYDSNTGKLVGTSNRIILTTDVTLLVSHAFDTGGSATTVTAPATVGITATVSDIEGAPQQGLTVRFSIVDDSTDSGASLSRSTAVTDASGEATTSLTVPDNAGGTGATVSVLVEVVDAAGNTVVTGNVIVATATP